MSISSEETHDDSEQVHNSEIEDPSKPVVKGDSLTGSQDSKGTGCQQSFGHAEQGTGATAGRQRKRTLSEARLSDVRLVTEDEQHSFQSAFQQYRPSKRSQHTPPGNQTAATPTQAMQLLLQAAAAQRNAQEFDPRNPQQTSGLDCPSINSISTPHAQHDYPSIAAGGNEMRRSAQQLHAHDSRVHVVQPVYEPQQPALPSCPLSRTPQPAQHSTLRATPEPLLSHAHVLNPLYTPVIPKPKVNRQLVSAVRALEHPEMDADAVQAALEFADALDVSPAAAAALTRQTKHAPAPHNTAESIKLLQAVENSTGRLDVLRILIIRLASTGTPEGEEDTSMLSQLLLVIQDLMRDMESSQRLLQRAGAVLRSHQSTALQQVKTLKAYHLAMQEFWTQGQQLDRLHDERQTVLQHMLTLTKDETSQGLLNLFDSLRQSLVGALEIGARRNTASSDMQLAQAQLARQGVAGVTSDRLLSGSVQLVIDRANIRLDTLQRIIACLESSQAGLLAALTLTLDGSSWQHASDHKLVEAVSGTRGRAEHLLAQLRSAGHARAVPVMKTAATVSGPNRATVLDGVTAQIHDTIMSQAGAVPDNHPRHKEEEWMAARLARQRQNGRGSLVPEQPWGMTGVPHKSKGDPREHPHPTALAHLHAVAAQGFGRDGAEHVIVRPQAQRPSGQSTNLQTAPAAPLPFPPPPAGLSRLSPEPSSGSPPAEQLRGELPNRGGSTKDLGALPPSDRGPPKQDRRFPVYAPVYGRPHVLQLLSDPSDRNQAQGLAAARLAQSSPSLAREASLGASLPTGGAHDEALQASQAGGSEPKGGPKQDSQSPREGSQHGGAQADYQSIAAAYAQLCAFLKQQNKPPPPPL